MTSSHFDYLPGMINLHLFFCLWSCFIVPNSYTTGSDQSPNAKRSGMRLCTNTASIHHRAYDRPHPRIQTKSSESIRTSSWTGFGCRLEEEQGSRVELGLGSGPRAECRAGSREIGRSRSASIRDGHARRSWTFFVVFWGRFELRHRAGRKDSVGCQITARAAGRTTRTCFEHHRLVIERPEEFIGIQDELDNNPKTVRSAGWTFGWNGARCTSCD